MLEFERIYNQYHYTFQKRMEPKETIVCKLPTPDGDLKRVRAVYWATSPEITSYATLCKRLTSPYTLWEKLEDKSQTATAITAFKFQNTANDYKYVYAWVVME